MAGHGGVHLWEAEAGKFVSSRTARTTEKPCLEKTKQNKTNKQTTPPKDIGMDSRAGSERFRVQNTYQKEAGADQLPA